MTTKDKELLLKDLCGRLPYGVKLYDIKNGIMNLYHVNAICGEVFISSGKICRHAIIEDIKPYLFPMSSMTEEQKQELNKLLDKECDIIEDVVNNPTPSNIGFPVVTHYMVDWCNKNHFDYRGLIPMGSAIDATGLNIY